MRARQPYPTTPSTPNTYCLPAQPYPFLPVASVARALGIMSACPTRALSLLPPRLSPGHDQSPTAALMMNHSNLPDLKQKQGCYGFMGYPPPPSSEVWEMGRGSLSVCFVWLWLLCSWHLSPFPLLTGPSPTIYIFFLSSPPSPCSTWKLHGPLFVCVHVCACIYMYREIYM